jgi:hypothetical protein
MNIRTLLLTPWRATHRAMGLLALCMLVLCIAGGVSFAIFGNRQNALWAAVWLYGAALFFMWAFFFCSSALLAMDARWLRLPHLQRTAVSAVLLYAVLSLIPTFVLAVLFGGNVPTMCMVSLLCLLGGLSFSLLPRYIAMFVGLLPAMRSVFAESLHIPGVSDPRFLSWAITFAVILIVICVLGWRSVVKTTPDRSFGVTSPMVLQYRRNQWSGWAGMNGMCSTQQVRQRPDWMQPRPDLRHVGPENPAKAMRIALGGWYLPKTLMGHVQGLAPALFFTAIPFVVMFLIFTGARGVSPSIWWSFVVLIVGWICMFGSMGAVFMTVMLTQQRWRKANAELSVLALLPGLGDSAAAKRRLLLTTLRRPLIVQAVALLTLLVMTGFAHPATSAMLMLVAGQLGCAVALIACVLGILGGRPLPGWGTFTLMIAISLLIGCNSFLPNSMVGAHPWVPSPSFVLPVLGAWLIVGMAMAWLTRRGWAAWRRRPHAFLPNI